VSDLIDDAQTRQAEFNEMRIEEQARAAQLDAPGNERCADCHEPIPPARRRALPSAHRCVECQAFFERIGRLQNHG
jgi:phage/conjugal plasmid C-4 type zinc finger TraR family protein